MKCDTLVGLKTESAATDFQLAGKSMTSKENVVLPMRSLVL